MLPRWLHRARFNYVCHKELQAIKDNYGKERKEQAKMWMKYFSHRASTGFAHMKSDLVVYYTQLRKEQEPSQQQLEEKYRIEQDLKKLGPVFVLNLLPFSIVFLAAYVKLFPDALPSWFEVDQVHHNKQRHYHLKQCDALDELFVEESGINIEN